MTPQEPQRPAAGDDEKRPDGPFSFEVDIEPAEPEDILESTQPESEEIPSDPAEPPRYWPDDLFEPVEPEARSRAEADLRPDRALPPASALPAPTGEPIRFDPPTREEETVAAAPPLEIPEEKDEAAATSDDYLEPVEPIVHGLPPVPDVDVPTRGAAGPRPLPAAERLALPEAKPQKSKEESESLLQRVVELVSSPRTVIDKLRDQRLESRRDREASKTVEQREKERRKREERRAKRRKKEEKKRSREAARKRKADERRAAKLRRADNTRARSQTTGEPPAESARKKLFGVGTPVPRLTAASLPLIGRRLAAKAKKPDSEKSPKKREAEPVEDFSTRVAEGLRRRTARFRSSLQRNVIGLDIGASSLRAVRIKDGVPIEIYAHQLPEGIIIDGLLEEPDELVEELKRFWKLSGLRSKKVNFSLSNRMVTMRTKRLPAKHPDDIPQAVAMNAESLIYPMDPKESVLDYAEMSRSGPMSDLQITAADEDMAKRFARSVEKAGLVAVSCELGPLAAARALVIPRSPTRSHALINVGAEVSWMAVGSGPDVYFLRVIDIGGDDFTRSIAQEFGIDFLEAEGLKKRSGLGSAPTDPTLDAATFARCREALRRVSDHLCQELAQTKRYWDEGRPERTISSWGLLGGGGRLAGLREQIAVFAGLQGPETLVAYPGFESAENLDLNATALGLARGNTMSLLPDPSMKDSNVAMPGLRRRSKISFRRSRREGKKLAAGRKGQHASTKTLAILGCVVVLGGGYFMKMQTNPKIDEQKTALEAAQQSQQDVEAQAKKQDDRGSASAPHYINSPKATALAARLAGGGADGDALTSINTALTLVGAQDITIQVEGTTTTIEGTVTSSSGVRQLVKFLRANDSFEKVSSKAQSPIAGGTGFTIEAVSRS